MKIGKQTKEIIAQAEADIKGRMKRELEVWKIRLAEHHATKRAVRQIERIDKTIERVTL